MKNIDTLFLLALALGMGGATGATAQTIPDLKGTWVAGAEAIIDGSNPYHPDASPHPATSGNYILAPATLTLNIEGQDGRRFWGTKSTEHHTERLLGSVGTDGRSIYMVDEDGFTDGLVVDNDTIDYCYRHIAAEGGTVACGLAKRQE